MDGWVEAVGSRWVFRLARSPNTAHLPFLFWERVPLPKKGTLILISLLEDLGWFKPGKLASGRWAEKLLFGIDKKHHLGQFVFPEMKDLVGCCLKAKGNSTVWRAIHLFRHWFP